jgi:hypothetical protein
MEHSKQAEALFKAIDDKRLTFFEAKYYEYIGTTFGKDLFRNRITDAYLD